MKNNNNIIVNTLILQTTGLCPVTQHHIRWGYYNSQSTCHRQQNEINKQRRNEETLLPDDIQYKDVRGLSNEALQKFSDQKPVSIGQASRIPGITPAAISLLLVHLKKHHYKKQA